MDDLALATIPQGRWLTFKIETYDHQGKKKTQGGDSWFIVLRDLQQKISFSTRVFDEGDGTYTVAAVIHTPGKSRQRLRGSGSGLAAHIRPMGGASASTQAELTPMARQGGDRRP